jgi:hypothetical protein
MPPLERVPDTTTDYLPSSPATSSNETHDQDSNIIGSGGEEGNNNNNNNTIDVDDIKTIMERHRKRLFQAAQNGSIPQLEHSLIGDGWLDTNDDLVNTGAPPLTMMNELHATDIDDCTLLDWCAMLGHTSAAQWILDHDDTNPSPLLNRIHPLTLLSPLHRACMSEHDEMAALLVSRGARKDMISSQGLTSLDMGLSTLLQRAEAKQIAKLEAELERERQREARLAAHEKKIEDAKWQAKLADMAGIDDYDLTGAASWRDEWQDIEDEMERRHRGLTTINGRPLDRPETDEEHHTRLYHELSERSRHRDASRAATFAFETPQQRAMKLLRQQAEEARKKEEEAIAAKIKNEEMARQRERLRIEEDAKRDNRIELESKWQTFILRFFPPPPSDTNNATSTQTTTTDAASPSIGPSIDPSSSEHPIRFDDIPWPSIPSSLPDAKSIAAADNTSSGTSSSSSSSVGGYLAFLLEPSSDLDKKDDRKKIIRESYLRFHPDRFTQTFGTRLLAADHDRIMAHVTHMAQYISHIKERVDKMTT